MITLRNAGAGGALATGGRAPNQHLADALARSGWSPRELVRTLNPCLDAVGEPALHLTAAVAG